MAQLFMDKELAFQPQIFKVRPLCIQNGLYMVILTGLPQLVILMGMESLI